MMKVLKKQLLFSKFKYVNAFSRSKIIKQALTYLILNVYVLLIQASTARIIEKLVGFTLRFYGNLYKRYAGL